MRSLSQITFCLVFGLFVLAGCGEKNVWRRSADVCIKESEEPPMHRVTNHVDRDLCSRPNIGLNLKRLFLRDQLPE